jgi:hypothetical protein
LIFFLVLRPRVVATSGLEFANAYGLLSSV